VDPRLVERSRAMLDKGYQKLVSFECKKKGYEWFGGDPGHEALTAYGLLEFTDMAQVRPVDDAMLARTRQWLMGQRDGKGGFLRNKRALDSFGRAPGETTDAYVVWSLLEGGEVGLEKEIAAVKATAEKSEDSYVIALAANILSISGDKAGARKNMDRLVKKQTKEGWVDGAVTSITRSGGDSLTIETTSLAILAWLRDPDYAAAVEKGIRYLAEACKAGRYGSTQSTVLALRAIVAYDKARAKPKKPGTARIYVDGQPVGDAVAFDADTQGAIQLPDIAELLEPGKHKIELKMEDGAEMPYALTVNYHTTKPISAKECQVALHHRGTGRSDQPGRRRHPDAHRHHRAARRAGAASRPAQGARKGREDSGLRSHRPRGRPLLARDEGRPEGRAADQFGGCGPRHLHRPRQPRLPLLHRRAQALGGRPEGRHHPPRRPVTAGVCPCDRPPPAGLAARRTTAPYMSSLIGGAASPFVVVIVSHLMRSVILTRPICPVSAVRQRAPSSW